MHINRSIGISLSVACGLANCLAHGGHSHFHRLQRSAPRDVAEEFPEAVSLVRRGLAEVRDLAERSANSVEVPEEELRGMLDKIKLLEGQVMELLPAEAPADSASPEPTLVDPVPVESDTPEGDEQQTSEDEALDPDSTELSDDESPIIEVDTEDNPTEPDNDPASADLASAADGEAPEITAVDSQEELDENAQEAKEAGVSNAAEDGAVPLETPAQTEVASKDSGNTVTPAGLGAVFKENVDAEESTTTITSTRTVTSTTTVPWVEPITMPQTTSPVLPQNDRIAADYSGRVEEDGDDDDDDSRDDRDDDTNDDTDKSSNRDSDGDDSEEDNSDEDDDDDDGEDDDASEDSDDDDDDRVSQERVATEAPKVEDITTEGAEADVTEKAALTTEPTTAPAGVALKESEDTPLPAEAVDASIPTTESSPLTEATVDVSSETLEGVTSTPPVTPLAVEEVTDTAESSPTNKADGSSSPSGFRTVTIPSKTDE